MSNYELAQLNIAIMKAPLESPEMAEFTANLDRINSLADQSPGFIWRYQTEEGDATAVRPMGEYTLVNMSVWRDVASLHNYVYKSVHADIMKRRKEWFDRMSEAYLVLWWVPRGHRPSIEEATTRLSLLRENGPTPEAFTMRRAYPPPDADQKDVSNAYGANCPAN